jgi:hypothetical protein
MGTCLCLQALVARASELQLPDAYRVLRARKAATLNALGCLIPAHQGRASLHDLAYGRENSPNRSHSEAFLVLSAQKVGHD